MQGKKQDETVRDAGAPRELKTFDSSAGLVEAEHIRMLQPRTGFQVHRVGPVFREGDCQRGTAELLELPRFALVHISVVAV